MSPGYCFLCSRSYKRGFNAFGGGRRPPTLQDLTSNADELFIALGYFGSLSLCRISLMATCAGRRGCAPVAHSFVFLLPRRACLSF